MNNNNEMQVRPLGPTELYCDRCHAHGGNLNVMVALTIHTRNPLDTGIVKVTLQELQHQYPQLTSRISRKGGKERFVPMECPTLPLDADLQCPDMLHHVFDTLNGPLWRVQIITKSDLDTAKIAIGPEVEAIIEDDSSLDTRWRYFLRYLQGSLNQDIDSFEDTAPNKNEENEEGRSVVFMTFHPAVTDTTGAIYLAKQFMSILDMLLESDGPIKLGEPEGIPKAIETLLPSQDSVFQLGDIFPMVKAFGNHLVPTSRKSPLDGLLSTQAVGKEGEVARTQYLRGWLTQAQTTELLGLCEEDDVSLCGLLLAAGLTAMARVCLDSASSSLTSDVTLLLKAAVSTNLRQYCNQAPRYGCFSATYEENYNVPPMLDNSDFWRYAHEMSMSHNTAKSTRAPLRQLRKYAKIFSTPGAGGEDSTVFRDMEASRRISNDLTVSVHGDLGHIFRRESNVQLDSWSKHELPPVQVKLEDIFPMVAGQNMGSPVTHSAHIFLGRLNYILGYHTGYVDTSLALMVRDETINILRMAVEQ